MSLNGVSEFRASRANHGDIRYVFGNCFEPIIQLNLKVAVQD